MIRLLALPQTFAVCKAASLDGVNWHDPFVFVAKTDDELSLVCEADAVPQNVTEVESGWRALKIVGVLDFSMVGVIAGIATALASDNISLFVVSTFNTDYMLVKESVFQQATAVLRRAGYMLDNLA